MKEYGVVLHVEGRIRKTVEADSREAASKIAMVVSEDELKDMEIKELEIKFLASADAKGIADARCI